MTGKGPMHRYRLVLEYDGTNFSGWQKQADARSVQGDVLKAVARVFGEVAMELQGCGRTDSGVHALAYCAHLEVSGRLPLPEVARRLADEMPKDIALLSIEKADPRFHARYSCLARSYLYQLRTRKSAFGKRYSWWIREPLDLVVMRQAAAAMEGMHDFAAFAEKQELKKSTKVDVRQVRLLVEGDLIRLRVVGSHFLWHMVRRMVGVLVEVGCHRLTVADVRELLEAPGERSGPYTAPAAGLFFEKAFYDEDELSRFLAE